MIRQLFNLILIIALLGNQTVVCCGHSHEVGSDHSSRTHIHLGGQKHHHHHNDGHHHDHGPYDDHSNHEPSDSSDSSSLSCSDSVSHDNDAIYLAESEQQSQLESGDASLKKSPASLTIPGLTAYDHPESRIPPGDCFLLQPALTIAPLQQTSRLLI